MADHWLGGTRPSATRASVPRLTPEYRVRTRTSPGLQLAQMLRAQLADTGGHRPVGDAVGHRPAPLGRPGSIRASTSSRSTK